MPSTHTSLHYHLVFSTKDRRPEIGPDVIDDLHRYAGGVVRSMGGIPLEIGGVMDHIHLLVGLKPTHILSDVLRDLKKATSIWMHEHGKPLFSWQEGYGAFTASKSTVPPIREYIRNQEAHHRHRTFQEEYLSLLEEHEIDFDRRYLW